jgi:nitrite reductase (cytochrome c-552)
MNTTEKKRKPWVNWVLFFATIVVVFLLGLLASSITQRRAEKDYVYKPMVKLSEYEPRNEVWGKNFPREYQSYLQTKDTSFRSKHGGSAMRDMLGEGPELVVLWAGYGFSKDYNQGRGHYYAVDDVVNTLRTGAPTKEEAGPMPATCWTCKSPDVPRLMNEIGVKEFYDGVWKDHGSEIHNGIGCADCHDPKDMSLRITRPALIEAYERRGDDISDASHQEMRSLVCAQCHVEYYFKKDLPDAEGVPYLTFPWDDGMDVDAVEAYYDKADFSDWTHKLSKAPMLKAQHPDYEVYKSGIHAKRGVSCADCHMPYKSEGGQKFTDHHVQSPLNNISNSCQVCHREETKDLIRDVYERQDKLKENRVKLEELLVHAHVEAAKAWELGATEDQMEEALMDIRHAQWRWDYAAATHGGSFHAPVEMARIVSSGLIKAQDARLKLSRILAELGHNKPVPYPDIATKAKAQEYIGLDMDKLNEEKQRFLNELYPEWVKKAEEREEAWGIEYY